MEEQRTPTSSAAVSGRILVVDDEPAVRLFCKEALSQQGYVVHSTGKPTEVLSLLRSNNWDLLLSDITMPEMSGIELLQEIRRWDPDFPVILFTGYGTYDRALDALRLGADDLLNKPVRVDALRRSVQSVIVKKWHRKERERRRALERLLSMGVALAGEVEEDRIFTLLENAVQAETGAERVSIMRPTGDGFLHVAHSTNLPEEIENRQVRLSESVTRSVFETGEPLRVEDIRQDTRFPSVRDLYKSSSFMCLPLIQSDKVQEVLTLADKTDGSAFSLADEEAAKALALHGAVALDRARLFKELRAKIEETEELFYGTVHAISNSLDAKSPWTQGHSERVMTYSIMIGKELRLSEDALRDLELAALLHDVGKIGTYDALLEKPGELTVDEYAHVKDHPVKGEAILRPLKKLAPILPAIRNHHERFDGNGYPDGLKGDEIPFFARILSIADTFDSMTSQRPYRRTPGRQHALRELQENAGIQFDPIVVPAFLKALNHS